MSFLPLQYPLVNGVRHSFASIELNFSGLIFRGFKSINYGRKRNRGLVRGNHPDPIAKTLGENEYNADAEIYLAEWMAFLEQLKANAQSGTNGNGYGDVQFSAFVTYSATGFDTITDELQGCTLDSTDASNGQGPDALVRKVDLMPLKILFAGVDDLLDPLSPPPQ